MDEIFIFYSICYSSTILYITSYLLILVLFIYLFIFSLWEEKFYYRLDDIDRETLYRLKFKVWETFIEWFESKFEMLNDFDRQALLQASGYRVESRFLWESFCKRLWILIFSRLFYVLLFTSFANHQYISKFYAHKIGRKYADYLK